MKSSNASIPNDQISEAGVGLGRAEGSGTVSDETVLVIVSLIDEGKRSSGACQRRQPCSSDELNELKNVLSILERPKSASRAR